MSGNGFEDRVEVRLQRIEDKIDQKIDAHDKRLRTLELKVLPAFGFVSLGLPILFKKLGWL